MFFPRQSNLPTTPFTAAHHASRLALTLVASLLLAACGSSTPTPATPTPTPLLAPNLGTVSAQTYTQGGTITPLVFGNTGGDVTASTGCAVDDSATNPALPAGLDVEVVTDSGKRTCQITGAPTEVVSPARMVTITATNTGGQSSVMVSITVNPAAPSLQASDPVERSYPTGALVSLVLDNDGGDVTDGSTGCDVDTSDGKPELPAGLDVEVVTVDGKRTCQITGTPDTATPAANYDITATNDGGSSTVTVNIAVPSGVASFATPEALVYAVGDSVNVNFINTNAAGSRVNGCVVPTDGTLPAGLSIDAIESPDNGCVLTGTANTITEKANYTITVTNDNGTASLTLDITVNPATPKLSGVNAQVYAPNIAITPLVFTNTGGDVTNDATGCTVGTSGGNGLPTGLSVGVVTVDGKRTCQITGMPTEAVNPARMVTITATNVTGSDTVTVLITVHSGIVPDSLSAQALFRYEAGRATTRQITFTDTVGAITSCTVPDMIDGMLNGLPDGMMINSGDCTISGAPSRITAETTTHTITAMHADTTTSMATISIETYLSARPLLSDYSGVTLVDGTLVGVTLVAGSTVGLPIVLQNTGGMVGENGCQTSFSSDAGRPPLSSFDLVLAVTANNSSCEIRAMNNTDPADPADPAPPATPTGTLDKAVYTIRATNDLGVSEASVTFTIIGADASLDAPTLTAPAGSPFTFATNTAITPIDFAPSGKLGICTISPALPDGLRFDRSTCQISGTPRKALAMMTTYTVTAANKASPAATLTNTATVDITVTNAAPPSLESMIDLNLTMNSNAGLPFAIANIGGSPTSCIPTPTTAGDDALDSYNLTVLVADGTCVIDSLDGNGPSRTLDGGSFTITASGGSTSTLTLNLRTPITPQITAGHDTTCAINSAQQLLCWGLNSGLGNPRNTSTPALLTGNDWAQVGAGDFHTCAINESGQLWCWGNGGFGQLGLGNNRGADTPTQVVMVQQDGMSVVSANDWMQVSTGADYTCAIKASGQLWCWGNGANGRLGLGNDTGTNTPTQVVRVQKGDMSVVSANDWMQVSTGARHTCAIKASGQLWCWGNGANGRLGLGNDTGTNTPEQVGGDDGSSDWMQVSSGVTHTCAINTSRELWCWGRGDDGQLGLGDNDGDGDGVINNANTPTRVGMASNWTQVSAGDFHTCVINTSGQLWCWGDGSFGQLGLDDASDTNTPTQVEMDEVSDWTQVSAGSEYTCAITASGQVWCWGRGVSGQLGLGSGTSMSTPMRVPGILLQ